MKPRRKGAALTVPDFDSVAAQPLETIGDVPDTFTAEETGGGCLGLTPGQGRCRTRSATETPRPCSLNTDLPGTDTYIPQALTVVAYTAADAEKEGARGSCTNPTGALTSDRGSSFGGPKWQTPSGVGLRGPPHRLFPSKTRPYLQNWYHGPLGVPAARRLHSSFYTCA